MVWTPFSKPAPQQIEQRSHTNMGIVKEGESDIAHTLGQIAPYEEPKVKVLTAESLKVTNDCVTDFVEKSPKNLFIIDGEKYANESIICTNDARGQKTCLKLKYNLIELFKQMQRLDYFCSLPNDINATYFECRKIT